MLNKFKDYQNKVGVLITNLGTPNEPTKSALKKYLNQFLLDKRVVDIPRVFWIPLLKLVILNVRPKKSAKLYKSIWTDQGSPLLKISNSLLENLKKHMQQDYPNIHFELGMRYGDPSIFRALKNFKKKSISKILVFPLYPQAGSPTTASTFDYVSIFLKKQSWMPNIRFISGYHDHLLYIDGILSSVKKSFHEKGRPDILIFSFHGMPERYLKEGDPYYCFCHKTARLVAEKLKLNENQYKLAFQSRFGFEEWLKPYIDEMIPDLAKKGVKKMFIISPGFSVDCLETLEEIDIQYRKLFLDNGGDQFEYIPCLNHSAEQIQLISSLVEENIQGW